jgi:hypothetical protein
MGMKAPTIVLGSLVVVSTVVAVQPAVSPRVVAPGKTATGFAPPSDAVVLFDGTSLAAWTKTDGTAAGWTIEDGAMVVNAGSIITKEKFGDVQVHVEFATPAKVEGEGQGRGNSGVYLQGRYEVQVLDSFKNETYPDGQCAAIYKQHPPMVNACRGPGEWQTYDIVFRGPRFDAGGKKVKNATLTVLHNGVLVHDNAEVTSPTGAAMNAEEGGDGPIYLQDHGNPVRYRNVWVRRLE